MKFEDFTKKLAVIQSNDYLTIEETIDIKRHIAKNSPAYSALGAKPLQAPPTTLSKFFIPLLF